MSNIVPFSTSGNLPSFLAGAASNDSDLTAHASLSFPVISIKGKVFTIVRDGVRKIIPNPRDPQSPASRLEVIIVKASPNKSKAYYDVAFKDGEDIKPRCFSNNGKTPDPSVEHPCAKSCATCPFNAFGSRKNPDGTMGKGKACSDSVRIAVATPDNIVDPYMIRVPATSMKALGELGRSLATRKIPYQAVVTQISFDPNVPTPRLVFKPVGFVDEASYRSAMEESASDTVHAIIGEAPIDTEAEQAMAAELEDARHEMPAEKSPTIVTRAEAEYAIHRAKEAQAAPAVKVTHDEVKEALAPVAEPKPAPAPKAATGDDLIDAFSNLDDFDV